MRSIHVDIEEVPWASAVPFYGPGAVYEGKDIVQLKILCDRRREGAGITWIVRFAPPPGKLLKIIAVARSDEHVFVIEGGRVNKAGHATRAGGGYSLNPDGQPHSAMVSSEMIALIVYTGEPDEVKAIELVERPPSA